MSPMRAAHPRAAAATAARYERRRPEQTPLYRLVRQHYERFADDVEHASSTGLPKFVKDEFDAYLDCGILAHGFMRLTCEGCARDTLRTLRQRNGIQPARTQACIARPMTVKASNNSLATSRARRSQTNP